MKKGILVGDFSEEDLNKKLDLAAVKRKQEETGLPFPTTRL